MTAGEDALIEAMRHETARIYGQVQHEHCSDASEVGVCTRPFVPHESEASNVTHLAPLREQGAA